jgi:pimeloyl-ACP methyl ester carboxylesterase
MRDALRRKEMRSVGEHPRHPSLPESGPPPAGRMRTFQLLGASGAALGLLAWANARAAREAERNWPPQGRILEVRGVPLHMLEQGSGPRSIVLLHGNGAMAEDFAISGVMERLARRHHVLAFDRPGFGHSGRPSRMCWDAPHQAALLREALGRLGVSRPVLVGHSWGALVALHMALQAPGGTGALVLLSGYVRPERRLDAAMASIPALPGLGKLLCHTVLPPLADLLGWCLVRRIFAPQAVPPRFRRAFPWPLASRPSALGASAAETACMHADAARLVGREEALNMPVMILAGLADRMVAASRHSVPLHHALPGSRLRLFPGAGHMLHHSHPDAVVDAIEAVLAEAGSHARSPG